MTDKASGCEMIDRVARAIARTVPGKEFEITPWSMQAARAAIEAMLEPTVEMVAAAFPCERDEDFDLAAKKLGAAACLLLGGGKDIGLLEGEAVKQAAFLVRDYRLMIAAATGT